MAQIKQRTTIILSNLDEESFHERVEIKSGSIELPKLKYKRQDRHTIPVEQLPPGWAALLNNCQAFRLQYSQVMPYDHSIFGDFIQDGLNINLIPSFMDESTELEFYETLEGIMISLKQATKLDVTPGSYIVTPVALKYYQQTLSDNVLKFIFNELTGQGLTQKYNSIQIDYDGTQAETLGVEVYWDSYNKADTIEASDTIRKEIGVFTVDEKLTNIDNVGLNGVRFVLDAGEPETKKTSFQYIPRQRVIPGLSFEVNGISPAGLHPTLELSLQNTTSIKAPLVITGDEPVLEELEICKLYGVWNIPKQLFVDRYQVTDEKFHEKGVKLLALFGESSLELPDYMMPNWGTEAFFELDASKATSFTIPLHSRYAKPNFNDSIVINLQPPKVFWACDLALPIKALKQFGSAPELNDNKYSREIAQFESELQVLSNSPFHHKFLDYESYFDDNTVFYQIEKASSAVSTFTIPTGNITDNNKIQSLSFIVVILSSLYLLRKLFSF